MLKLQTKFAFWIYRAGQKFLEKTEKVAGRKHFTSPLQEELLHHNLYPNGHKNRINRLVIHMQVALGMTSTMT